MTGEVATRIGRRRSATEKEIRQAAWAVIERDGVAALSMGEVARAVGMRPQSLYEYFASKRALLDVLFREGFTLATERLQAIEADSPRELLMASVHDFLEFCVDNPGRFHLMLQRSVPGFAPSPDSLDVAATSLGVMLDRATAAGIREPGDLDILRALLSGLASEQIANQLGGHRFISQADRAVSLLLLSSHPTTSTRKARPR